VTGKKFTLFRANKIFPAVIVVSVRFKNPPESPFTSFAFLYFSWMLAS
jgi:hypothetical protein